MKFWKKIDKYLKIFRILSDMKRDWKSVLSLVEEMDFYDAENNLEPIYFSGTWSP